MTSDEFVDLYNSIIEWHSTAKATVIASLHEYVDINLSVTKINPVAVSIKIRATNISFTDKGSNNPNIKQQQ